MKWSVVQRSERPDWTVYQGVATDPSAFHQSIASHPPAWYLHLYINIILISLIYSKTHSLAYT